MLTTFCLSNKKHQIYFCDCLGEKVTVSDKKLPDTKTQVACTNRATWNVMVLYIDKTVPSQMRSQFDALGNFLKTFYPYPNNISQASDPSLLNLTDDE